MIKLKLKLSLFNLLSKIAFTALFFLLLPYITQRISLHQVDNDLIQKREQVISIISEIGIEPFITSDSSNTFGNYNILKEEFISLERIKPGEDINYIEVTSRLIEGDEIMYRVLSYSFIVDDQPYLLEIGKSLSSIYHMEKNMKRIMFIFLAFIILITFLTDMQYTRHILRPLDKITKKLDKIPDPSKFDMTPAHTTTSDFMQLDASLRGLMDHINLSFQKEKEITVDISHELLTPVSVLRSKLENLQMRKDLDADVTLKIEESLKTLHRLQSLVNSLLMIARIESHQYLREDDVSINDILSEIIEEIRPVAEDSSVTLQNEIIKDFVVKKTNRSLIFSMFSNIINNALKNTPGGGSVEIKSSLTEKFYSVDITDTGKGMTADQMKTLFSRFKARTDNKDNGTGIGLAIAKSIADFHNIQIKVASSPGKGSNFSFIFSQFS
jgi:signal transduction histidine kinase